MGIRADAPHNDYLIELIRAALLHTQLPTMPEDCHPEALANLIRSQQIVNLVYPVLSSHPELACVRASLERSYMLQIPKITNQDLEINKWLSSAEAQGIDCIPLKGYWLRQLYPSPMMRSMTDFDVLLREFDREKINPWMISLGYDPKEEDEIDYHDSFSKKPWMCMELHRHLSLEDEARQEWERQVWKNAVAIPGHKHIFRMCYEDFYIYHLLHMHKHFMARGSGMKGIIDIYVFLEAHGKDLNRDYLNIELQKLNLDTYCAFMERLAYVWLGDLEATADDRMVTDYVAGCGMFGNNATFHAIRIASDGGNIRSNKFRYRMKVLFPNVQQMKRHFPSVVRFPYLLPFYWVARVFKSVFIKKKKASDLKFDAISDEQYGNIGHILTITGAKK